MSINLLFTFCNFFFVSSFYEYFSSSFLAFRFGLSYRTFFKINSISSTINCDCHNESFTASSFLLAESRQITIVNVIASASTLPLHFRQSIFNLLNMRWYFCQFLRLFKFQSNYSLHFFPLSLFLKISLTRIYFLNHVFVISYSF